MLGIIRSIGAARLAAIVGVTAGVALALALIMARLGEPPLSVLYADLDLKDAQSVVERLEQDGVRHEVRERGGRAAVLAPRSEAARLRMALAADGVIRDSGVGYEIFDEESAFGSTSFQQSINRLRALEGELARTIASIDGVRAARVHLVLPERELFAREERRASASIVIDAPSGLDQRAVRAILNLVSSAAPGLTPQSVTLLDASGALLASGAEEGAIGGAAEERTAAAEARIRRTVEDIVGRIVGPENLRVQVAADMDFNRVTENAEIIDPDSQTVISSSLVEDAADAVDPATGRGVTVANALPGATTAADGADASTSTSRRTEETTNYEISRTVRSEVREQGSVKRLSVAVAINADPAGARATETMARIEALVRSAVGYDEARGDRVEIVEVAFAPVAALAAETATPAPTVTREDAMRLAEIAALALIALALVLFVLRPMFSGRAQPATPVARASADDGVVETISTGAAQAALPAPRDNAFEKKIDLARVEGQVKASSLNKVSEVVRGHADESAGILKGWIRQAS